MTKNELQILVEKGESNHLEFKRSTTQLKPAFETVVGFLNNDGGTVLIGVANDGKIIGQDVTDNTRQEIAKELAKIEPPAQANIEISYIPIGKKKQVIAIAVKSGNHAPHIYNGRAFYRNQSTTMRMPQHQYEQLLIERRQLNYVWEEQLTDYQIDALDHEEIYQTINEAAQQRRIPTNALNNTIEDILLRLKLMESSQLKQAAITLFGKKDILYFTHCLIKLARFNGTDKICDFIDNKQIFGNAFSILDETEAFLSSHLPIASFFSAKQFKRIDKPMLPALAVREALINAICHRDYANHSGAITLAIFDDRLEIWNNGLLPKEIKIEDLEKSHGSWPRNERIANIFYLRGYIETWGTGTNKMIEYCQKAKCPAPIFSEYSGGFSVTFKFNHPIGRKNVQTKTKNAPAKKKIETTTVRQENIMELLHDKGELSAHTIHQSLKNPPTLRTIKLDLSRLQEKGLIEQIGKARNTVWRLPKDK